MPQSSVLSETDVLTSTGYPDGGGERIQLEEQDGNLIDGACWNRLCLTGNQRPVRSEIEAAYIEIPLIPAPHP